MYQTHNFGYSGGHRYLAYNDLKITGGNISASVYINNSNNEREHVCEVTKSDQIELVMKNITYPKQSSSLILNGREIYQDSHIFNGEVNITEGTNINVDKDEKILSEV